MKILLASILVLPLLAQGQKPQAATSAEPAKSAPEEGIPVTNQLVISKCGGCHTKDDKGQHAAHLLGARHARRLGRSHQAHGAFARRQADAGRSAIDSEISGHLSRLGARRSQAGDVLRRASDSGRDQHPQRQRARRMRELPSDGAAAFLAPFGGGLEVCSPICTSLCIRRPTRHSGWESTPAVSTRSAHHSDPGAPLPVDDRARVFGKTAPLHTPEWAAWRARMRAPKLAGRWLVTAYIPGRGKYYRRDGSGSRSAEPTTSSRRA